MDLCDFVESLYCAESFEEAFQVYAKEVQDLGFTGVLYTYIPRVVIEQSLQPTYKASAEYCPRYLQLYQNARFDLHDPLIKAISNGVSEPIEWLGLLCAQYSVNPENRQVIDAAINCGIQNGLTIPLMSDQRGISFASFITRAQCPQCTEILNGKKTTLYICTELFHSIVISNIRFTSYFVNPVFKTLNSTERALVVGLASGKMPSQIASELDRTEKYLEQVTLRVRRKMSGVAHDEAPKINRNQMLYYAGLLNMAGSVKDTLGNLQSV